MNLDGRGPFLERLQLAGIMSLVDPGENVDIS